MEAYDYKVVNLKVEISSGDLGSGKAGPKVAAQIEMQLKEYAREGWEFHQVMPVEVKVKKGCLGAWLEKGSPDSINLYTMVFRRVVK